MFNSLPQDATSMLTWSWSQFEPYYQDLAARSLTAGSVASYLTDWTRLYERVDEVQTRLYTATTRNTTDQETERRYHTFLNEIYPFVQEAEQRLKEKLLRSNLQPVGFEIPLRKLRTEAALFRPANIPLLAQEQRLINQYSKIIGAQTVQWQGQETTLTQLQTVYQNPDRVLREQAWRLAAARQLADREAINDLWQCFFELRQQLATQADLSDYRAYRWRRLGRFDYTPDDCARFHEAIEAVVVPVAQRIHEKRRRRLGIETLRPWDLNVDPLGRPLLRPFQDTNELQAKVSAIFHQIDPQLGAYFDTMAQEGLLDLDNRQNKEPGAYSAVFPAAKRPFIFMNAIGVSRDVQVLLHESGHGFHTFEASRLPYFEQRQVGQEFNEVTSMAMEFLAGPYLTVFYNNQADAARARIEHLEYELLAWPYTAVVDAFQHWAYENPTVAIDPTNCDTCWAALWQRFMPGVDWRRGLEQEMMTGWHRKLHIFFDPFYYIEYGLARLGAVQIWRNSLSDPAGAVANYRRASALGGTAPLPQLFATAGAKFAFDPETLRSAVSLIEETIAALEEQGMR